MLKPDEAIYQKHLTNGLVLRTVSSEAELERIAALNDAIHEPGVGEMTRKIFACHPNTSGRDLVYIENADGETIATLCLIPWTLALGGVDLPAAELGIVGTLERYRNQGLNRILMDYFWQRVGERGALLSIIQGIPYFYRQYSYEYAMLPLEGGWRIQPDQVPAPVVAGYSTRPACAADIPLLVGWYDAQASALDLSARRSAETWRYLLERTERTEAMQHDTLILLDPGGKAAGYLRVPDFHFYQELLTIDEVSKVDFAGGLAVLAELKKLAGEQKKDGIRLHLAQGDALLRIAKSFGAQDLGVYSWQVSIPDRRALLRQVAPALEQRVACSLFAGLSGVYSLDLYKEVISLTFQDGRITEVGAAKEGQRTILNVPPVQFTPLVLGGRTLEEIRASFPDAFYHTPWRLLVDTLFPRNSAFLATQY